MGFYYGPGNEPQKEEKPGFRETVSIIFIVFRILALPLGIILGVVLGFVFLFWLFTVQAYLGFGLIGLLVLALVARGVWEAKHPPNFE